MNPLTVHCTDEQLLAFLDGELALAEAAGIQGHLPRCWQCRARMQEIESRAQQLALLLLDPSFLGPERVQAARDKFLAAAARVPVKPHHDASVLPFPRRKLEGYLPAIPVSAWAAAILILAGAASLAWLSLPHVDNAAQTIAAAVHVEASVVRHPIHQEIAISLVQSKPRRLQQDSRLEIWSDAASNRYSAKWLSKAGNVSYAVWQPGAQRRFRYDEQLRRPVHMSSATHQGPRAITSIVHGPANFAAIQQRFETWIATREWQPLALAQDFSLFINTEGVLLRTEAKTINTHPILLISATSTQAGQKMTVSLELDSSHRVRAQEIRLESADESVGLRLAIQREDRMQITPQMARLFTPDLEAAAAVPRIDLHPKAAASVVSQAVPAPPSPAELADMQVKLEYELHRIRACVDDSLAIRTGNSGEVQVSGVVDTAERQAQILEAIHHLAALPWVHASIQTLEQASAAGISQGMPQPASLSPLPSAAASRTSVETLPLDTFLTDYFAMHALPPVAVKETPKTRTANYSSTLVSLSQKSNREAWAIRRLADKFSSPELLSRASLLLLEAMVRDHANELHQVIVQMSDVLEPVFGQSVRTVTGNAARDSEQQHSVAWPSDARALFDEAATSDTTLFDLFASGKAFPSQAANGKNPEVVMAALVTQQLPHLQRLCRELKTIDLDRASKQISVVAVSSKER